MEQVNEIIKRRGEHIPTINKQKESLDDMLDKLHQFDNLRKSIVDEEGNLRVDGAYSYLIKYPNVVASIYNANTSKLYPLIEEHRARLEKLKKRFERKCLTIQIFGGAGSGKSTFIQTITDLDNNVVMTAPADQDHCTGTTSYIRNSDDFEARIFPYTKLEIVNIFNEGLKNRLKDKGLREHSINSFDEIQNFDLAEAGLDETDYIVSQYINNFEEIKSVVEDMERNGIRDPEDNRKYIRIKRKEDVQQYVAHHNGLGHNDENYKNYKKYLAIKYVRILTPFAHKDAGNIECLDSVGFGDPTTQKLVEQEMYQAIADNCDIVSIICYPKIRSDISNAANIMELAHYEGIGPNKVERISNSCLFLVLNNDRRPKKDNTDDCNFAKSAWTDGIDPHVDTPFHRTETILCADLHNQNDTIQNVLIPILEQVTKNLPQIDEGLTKEVNTKTDELQLLYQEFVQRISDVLTVRPAGGGPNDFYQRFTNIYERNLRAGLLDVVNNAKCGINTPAATLGRALRIKCNDDSIAKYIEELDDEINNINPAATPAEKLNTYEKLASRLAHLVPSKFKDIDIDLNNNTTSRKAAIFDCIYDIGKLSTILKKRDDASKSPEENTLDWAAKLNELIITETEYPILHGIINELLAFNISVDGLLLFRIVKHFDELVEASNLPNPLELQRNGAKAIRFHLGRNLRNAFDKIRPELENFTLAPNEAIYYALDSFTYNLLYHPDIEKELRELYWQYEKQIWREELEQIQAQTIALEDWKNIRDKLANIQLNSI